ncbi:methylated-DNA--[protein]-cysteine S-methyltransferase [Nocardia sp. NPDC003482]
MDVFTTVESPVGELVLVGEKVGGSVVLTRVSMGGGTGGGVEWGEGFAGIVEQLRGYFAGEVRRFDVEVRGVGSEFQRRVWGALDEIPYGSTVSYGEIAARVGAPRAAVRAVGAAIGANPLLIVRPCHRVIGANGSLTGYAGGIERKRRLLELEGVG